MTKRDEKSERTVVPPGLGFVQDDGPAPQTLSPGILYEGRINGVTEPGTVIPFDEGFFIPGQLSPSLEVMIEQDNANRAASEQQRTLTLDKHAAEIERMDQQLSSAFGDMTTITAQVVVDMESMRLAMSRMRGALAEMFDRYQDRHAQRMWPWLAYGLIVVLALLTALLVVK